jgi:hypothetical protein
MAGFCHQGKVIVWFPQAKTLRAVYKNFFRSDHASLYGLLASKARTVFDLQESAILIWGCPLGEKAARSICHASEADGDPEDMLKEHKITGTNQKYLWDQKMIVDINARKPIADSCITN